MSAFLNERSPNRIRWERHSSLTDRTQRSAKAFKLGLRGGSRRHFTPPAAKVSRNSALELGIAIVRQVATAVEMSHPLQCDVASHLTHPARLRMICDRQRWRPSGCPDE